MPLIALFSDLMRLAANLDQDGMVTEMAMHEQTNGTAGNRSHSVSAHNRVVAEVSEQQGCRRTRTWEGCE